MLRLSQGQPEAAEASIRSALQETRDRRSRVILLGAGVEILLARKDVAGARAAADELAQLARQLAAPFVRALSGQASGAVALAEGRALAALERLRAAGAEAPRGWRKPSPRKHRRDPPIAGRRSRSARGPEAAVGASATLRAGADRVDSGGWNESGRSAAST